MYNFRHFSASNNTISAMMMAVGLVCFLKVDLTKISWEVVIKHPLCIIDGLYTLGGTNCCNLIGPYVSHVSAESEAVV